MRKTVIFDLDGTLANTLPDLHNSVNFALKEFDFSEISLGNTRKFVGYGLKMLIKRALPEGSSEETINMVLREMKAHYADHCNVETRPYEGIPELLMRLSSEGFRLATVSNKAEPMLLTLHRIYFAKWIPVAVGERPDLPRKPATDMVLEALRQLHSTAEDAVYVGDSEVDLQTAHNCNIPCLSVGWGFRSEEDLRNAGAGTVYCSPAELYDALTRNT